MSKTGIRPDLVFKPSTIVKGLIGEISAAVDEISNKFHSETITSVQLNLCNIRLKQCRDDLGTIAFNLLTIENVIDMSKPID
jgi:hypothetical protein